jgi:spermidine synthase
MEYVEVARASTERGDVVLRQRRDPDAPAGSPTVLELRVNGVFVMDTLETESEVALARAALEQVDHPRSVLVGGLGLGFTLHEVLSNPHVEHVVVAELEEPLVTWFRDGTVPHGPTYLADGRVHLSVAEVQQVVAEAPPGSFDVVLLDVDNGPDFLVHEENARIYEAPFMREVRGTLRPGGAVVVWSSAESAKLDRVLRETFGDCRLQPCPVLMQGRQETYWLYSAHHAAHHAAHTPAHHPEENDDG